MKVRGLAKVRAAFVFAMAAYNIVRLPKLYGRKGRSPASDMKSQRTTTRLHAKTPNLSRIQPKKSRLHSSLRKHTDFFSSLLDRLPR